MVWVAVARYEGDRQAPPVIDELITNTPLALNRGRNELDYLAYRHSTVQLRIVYRPGIRLGHLVEVRDALQGIAWRGKVVGLRYSNSLGGTTIDMDVQRPTINVEFAP
jgi:hypothetical protein